jgi:hypothetical protein
MQFAVTSSSADPEVVPADAATGLFKGMWMEIAGLQGCLDLNGAIVELVSWLPKLKRWSVFVIHTIPLELTAVRPENLVTVGSQPLQYTSHTDVCSWQSACSGLLGRLWSVKTPTAPSGDADRLKMRPTGDAYLLKQDSSRLEMLRPEQNRRIVQLI